ncbi:MAG: hypothetical protein, partial [Olavius algarvensis Gamma 1 endosymbiont]
LRPLRHFGQPLAPTPTADYPPRASRFPGGQRPMRFVSFTLIILHGPCGRHRQGRRRDISSVFSVSLRFEPQATAPIDRSGTPAAEAVTWTSFSGGGYYTRRSTCRPWIFRGAGFSMPNARPPPEVNHKRRDRQVSVARKTRYILYSLGPGKRFC